MSMRMQKYQCKNERGKDVIGMEILTHHTFESKQVQHLDTVSADRYI